MRAPGERSLLLSIAATARDNMAVHMRKILAIPRSLVVFASVLNMVMCLRLRPFSSNSIFESQITYV